MRTALRALIATLLLAAITGIAYPLVMTGIGQVAFAHDANGSLVDVNGQPVGSALIGQQWTGPQWFYGRPSAVQNDAATSSGTNLGPRSQQLADDIKARAAAILKVESPYTPGLTTAEVPVDLLTASGSGLDPDISVAAAQFQAPRIASVRGLPLDQVMSLIDAHTADKTLGFLGEPRVNVLELNIALQEVAPRA
ncbi:MAG TPA: potassium-transporting ATPase subunit KdpC [Actinomycetota bacterium]|jgi:K+-transporting ATPase ATPase C chain|nr:potassium-transporting ATPase subunit KdpC [Actinomycetota bacterium]